MNEELAAIIAGCTDAHRRLETTVDSLYDEAVRRPSLLPGWTVGHVLTHLARNADSHVRILDAALSGQAVEQYAGGYEERDRDIEAGSTRPAEEIRADVQAASAALEAAWAQMTPDAWDRHGLARGREWPCRWLPFHRWREVEIHHADLGLGYSVLDWPEEYVTRELPLALATVPDRLGPADRAAMLAWLVGRTEGPPVVALLPWQTNPEHYHRVPPGLGS